MDNDFVLWLGKDVLEYSAADHKYKVNRVPVPSITEILSVRFGHKYDGIPEDTLKRAAEAGTRMHEAVEAYINDFTDDGSEEVRNFRFLMKKYDLEPQDAEVPVILYDEGKPFAAGRLDMTLTNPDYETGIGDLKHTATLDKVYLTYQLNLYRTACEQTYGIPIMFLAGIHLRGEKRKLVAIPKNHAYTDEIIQEWKEKRT